MALSPRHRPARSLCNECIVMQTLQGSEASPLCRVVLSGLVVALSTYEAEYSAACTCAQEVVWLRGLLGDIAPTAHT